MAKSIQQIIADVASGKLTPEQGEAAIESLENENGAAQPGWTEVEDAQESIDAFVQHAEAQVDEQTERITGWANNIARNARNLAEATLP